MADRKTPSPGGGKSAGKVYDINAYRRKKKLKKLSHRLAAVLSALTLLGAAAAGIYFYRNYDLEELAQTVKSGGEETQVAAGHSFPVAMNGVSPVALSKVGSGVVLLTREETIFFDGSGSAKYNFTHQFTNPVVKSGGGRLLTYDRGGYGFRIDSESGLHYNARMENVILTGAMGRKLRYALVLSESRYAGSVVAFEKNNKELLRWYSASDQILDVDFTYDGNFLAVAAVGFQNGDVVGKVYLLDLKSPAGAQEAVYAFPGSLPLAVDCKKNGSIHLICDNAVGVVDPEGATSTVEISSTLDDYYFTDTGTVLLTSEKGGISFSLIQVDSEGERLSAQARGNGLDVVAEGESIYVLEKNVIQRFDKALEPVEQLPVGSDVFAIEASDGGIYLLSAGQLDRWREEAPAEGEP